MITVRFAPSPTGQLHVGNARSALVNYLFALKHKGNFILRMDDTDLERSKKEYADQIQDDLDWLGIHHSHFYRQSDRMNRYDRAIELLKSKGRLYPCYETQEELAMKRKLQLSQGKPPQYDRAALKLTDAQKAAFEAQGIKPHWRFLLESGDITWNDLVRGLVQFEGSKLSDPVLLREDGVPVYTLASVVDDLEMKVTHIIRGEDHVANTAIQIQLFEALGGDTSTLHFGHLQLLRGADGEEFSKRLGSMSLKSMREDGIQAMAVNSYLATIGTSEDINPFPDLETLSAQMEWSKFGRSSPKFDPKVLLGLNKTYLISMAYDSVVKNLESRRIPVPSEALWTLIRENIDGFNEVSHWIQVVDGSFNPASDLDQEFLKTAATLLPPSPFTEETWKTWADQIKEATGRKGKDLFMPLRRAITGFDHGPEMKLLLPLIPRETILKRLEVHD